MLHLNVSHINFVLVVLLAATVFIRICTWTSGGPYYPRSSKDGCQHTGGNYNRVCTVCPSSVVASNDIVPALVLRPPVEMPPNPGVLSGEFPRCPSKQ